MSQDYCRVCQIQIDTLWLRCPVCGALTLSGASIGQDKARESRERLARWAIWLTVAAVTLGVIFSLMGVITGGFESTGVTAPTTRTMPTPEP